MLDSFNIIAFKTRNVKYIFQFSIYRLNKLYQFFCNLSNTYNLFQEIFFKKIKKNIAFNMGLSYNVKAE